MPTTTFIQRFALTPSVAQDITAAVVQRVHRADLPEGTAVVAASGGGASVVVLPTDVAVRDEVVGFYAGLAGDGSAAAAPFVRAAVRGGALTLPIVNRTVELDDGCGIFLLEHGPAARERAVAIAVTGQTDQDG